MGRALVVSQGFCCFLNLSVCHLVSVPIMEQPQNTQMDSLISPLGSSVRMPFPLIAQLGFFHSSSNCCPKPYHRVLEVGLADPDYQWRQMGSRHQSKGRFVCLFGGKGKGDVNSKEAARRALENALDGKKDAFNRWDEEIKKREAAEGGGGDRGRGWFGGGGWFGFSGDEDSWKETQQVIITIAGLVFVYLLLVKGKSMMSFAVNSLLFLLRGFRTGFRSISLGRSRISSVSNSSHDSSRKDRDSTPGSAQANVIRKWGPE
eukprot:Gb_16981 [translate_table: standard]